MKTSKEFEHYWKNAKGYDFDGLKRVAWRAWQAAQRRYGRREPDHCVIADAHPVGDWVLPPWLQLPFAFDTLPKIEDSEKMRRDYKERKPRS